MFSAISSVSLSGMQAAEKRLANSANNVANIHSTHSQVRGQTVAEPFKPQDVQQVALEQGGVRTVSQERDPATIPVYAPDNSAANEDGVTEFPNVDLAEERVNQKVATYDFKANMKALQAADESTKALLDILA